MEDSAISVLARIRFLSEEEGGRTAPVRGGYSYRPNHSFWGDDAATKGYAIGLINLPLGQDIHPGEETEVEVIFLPWPELTPELHTGRIWRIQEGAKIVGYGEILKVLKT